MKFTSEDLMKAMGLQVGDRVEVMFAAHTETFTVHKDSYGCIILLEIDADYEECISYLLDQEYKILPRPKRVGDLKCEEFNSCETCPLQFVCNLYDCPFSEDNSLYNILTKIDVYDQEIYDLLKARLDKEVEEYVD